MQANVNSPARTADLLEKRQERAQAAATAEVARNDGKAGAMLSASSLMAAILVGIVPSADLSGAVAVLVGVGVVLNLAAIVVTLLVIRSRFGSPEAMPGSFLHWADLTPEQLVEDLAHDRRAEQTIALSQIARGKHRLVRVAVDLTVAAAAVLAVALVAALI
ncbi:Pycsar system effector family protein [Streptomyces sp. NPDC059382]|uniref:Pycsar system effector family protein n=1 Tax=Streptomyces sp. NPDC059382 TaxID=3346816 RepID=UPI003697239F